MNRINPCEKCPVLAMCRTLNKRECKILSDVLRHVDRVVPNHEDYNTIVKPIYETLNCYQIVFMLGNERHDLQFLRGDYIRDDGF